MGGIELQSIRGGRWDWGTGLVVTSRRFRNVIGLSPEAAPFFTDSMNIGYCARVERSLARIPERRVTLDARANGETGVFFASPLGRYAKLEGDLESRWFPRARGDDYEMRSRFRAGRTFGEVPLDELYVLGFDRDTDLWMRGHPGLRDGEKGNAPLGRGYVLENWEINKIVYSAPFFVIRAGPFLDAGKAYDPSPYFGSRKWMYNTGVQARIRVLGSFEFILGYGKDLRTGNNSFFTSVSK